MMLNSLNARPLKATISRQSFLFCGMVLLVVFFGACKRSVFTDNIKEGVIQYDVVYTNNSPRNFPMQLLPKTMELRFNEHFVSYNIEDRVGLFSICNINDLSNRSHTTIIKVFDKKYAYKGERNEAPLFFSNSLYTITPTSDTSRLIGVLCQKANINIARPTKNFDVLYYTNIGVQNPNANTPYEKIDGLLLDFIVQLKSLDMRLVAKNIEEQSIPDSEFIVADSYKFITKSKMEEIITTLLP